MRSMIVYPEIEKTMRDWSAERASMMVFRGSSPAEAVWTVQNEYPEMLETIKNLTISEHVVLPNRLWIWKCETCGAWNGTVHRPAGDEKCMSESHDVTANLKSITFEDNETTWGED